MAQNPIQVSEKVCFKQLYNDKPSDDYFVGTILYNKKPNGIWTVSNLSLRQLRFNDYNQTCQIGYELEVDKNKIINCVNNQDTLKVRTTKNNDYKLGYGKGRGFTPHPEKNRTEVEFEKNYISRSRVNILLLKTDQ